MSTRNLEDIFIDKWVNAYSEADLIELSKVKVPVINDIKKIEKNLTELIKRLSKLKRSEWIYNELSYGSIDPAESANRKLGDCYCCSIGRFEFSVTKMDCEEAKLVGIAKPEYHIEIDTHFNNPRLSRWSKETMYTGYNKKRQKEIAKLYDLIKKKIEKNAKSTLY